ncbi:hypothetical protein ACFPN2_16395 [Steroidobacter flavus]|uniref:Uncharacterized protein n=1 Tax=Steroidobacter flavus TaxID=1842136 RepID=A0ABV8SVV9_9GAMM
MKALRLLTILAACCATGTVSVGWAAEPAPAKPATPAAAKPADPKPAGESAAPKSDEQTQAQQGTKTEEDGEKTPAAKPAKSSGKGGSPERFVPSEQVRADFDVSFPIDI